MKKMSFTARNAMYGRGFISIWALGILLFFIVPLVQTVIYSFNDITTDNNGIVLTPAGIQNYLRMFTIDAEALPAMSSALLGLLYNVPLTVMFALLIAVMLNEKFVGRTVFRAIFFMPVIVMSGSVMLLFRSDNIASMLFGGSEAGQTLFQNITVLNDLFANLGWGEQIIGVLETVVSKVMDVCWYSGVQIILCMAALQSIPDTLYEAARVEGATKWEEFWKITFPMSTPVLFVCVIYTIIEQAGSGAFTNYIAKTSFDNGNYGYGSALAMFYCLAIVVVIGLVSLLLRNWIRNAAR